MTGAGVTTRLSNAEVDWVAGAPRSISFGDVYFSECGPDETRHVFLAGNDLGARFMSAARFSIGEFGFGTGLNFLETVALWRRTPKPRGTRLSYFSIEAFPLSAHDFEQAHAAWPAHAEPAARLRRLYPPPQRGLHLLEYDGEITLTLALGAADEMLRDVEGGIDAWFFDGFAPSRNPALWRPELFADAARLSRPGATFATYSVAGAARRAIEGTGFSIERRPGFGRKKQMLAGRLARDPARRSRRAPWFEDAAPAPLVAGARLAIVGGGIAGASLAHAAGRAGLQPTIFEAAGLGAGASGNVAGLVMPRLDLGDGPAARFFRAAYLHTVRLLNELDDGTFNPCGALLGATDDAARDRQRKIAEAALLPDGWIEARANGLFFPQAGVVDPPAFLRALAGETEIIATRATALSPCDGGVDVICEGQRRLRFDAVVLANAAAALRFAEARALPLAAIAGQIDWFAAAAAPPHVLAFGPYAAPAPHGGLVIGATYGAAPAREATRSNIAAVAAFAPELAGALDPEDSRPRSSFRCRTPDRLPVAGPLPDLGFYGAEYDGLRTGVRRDYPMGRMVSRVFILSGLGSRGLVAAPLAAAHVIAGMTGGISPLDYAIAEALHPARFFIRDMKRAPRTAMD